MLFLSSFFSVYLFSQHMAFVIIPLCLRPLAETKPWVALPRVRRAFQTGTEADSWFIWTLQLGSS